MPTNETDLRITLVYTPSSDNSPVEEVYELEAELVVDVLLGHLRVYLRRHHESQEELVHQLASRFDSVRSTFQSKRKNKTTGQKQQHLTS